MLNTLKKPVDPRPVLTRRSGFGALLETVRFMLYVKMGS